MRKSDSAEAWAKRSAELRRQVMVASGVWLAPTKTPLNAQVYGAVDRPEYTVERVQFESFPGHFVTGSLYRPKQPAAGERGAPLVLSPHGHWGNGRFHDHGEAGVKKEIENGAEQFEAGGRHPLQARCVQLARMGCYVFHWDMMGYADSIQLEHRAGVREAMNTAEDWGLFSPAAELRGQHPLAIQTWNTTRALDFALSLPGIDPKRIAVTGASGGGTQTFIAGATDGRPAALFPAVMVSTAMQGGCPCENAPYLRIGAGNIDIAALAAPRPLGVTAADDWTKEMETKGGPDLAALYKMLGIGDRFSLHPFLQFGHNYNAVSRRAMYGFMNKALGLGLADADLEERDYEPLGKDELTVWDDAHPAPTGDKVGDAHERALLQWWAQDSDQQLGALEPGSDRFKVVVGGAWEAIVGRTLAGVGETEWALNDKVDGGDHLLMAGVIAAAAHGEQVPALFAFPKEGWSGKVALLASLGGKNAAMLEGGALNAAAKALVAKGFAVGSCDLLRSGESAEDGKPAAAQPLAVYGNGKNAWQQFAGYTFGYNRPLFCQRAADLLTLIAFVKNNPKWEAKEIHLIAGGGAGPVAAAAAALAPGSLAGADLDLGGFQFTQAERFDDPNFVPMAVKFGGVKALADLAKNANDGTNVTDKAGADFIADKAAALAK
ncbi:MAG: hypothetical protein R3F11_14565 [Verrucomicrobiales bacterium]